MILVTGGTGLIGSHLLFELVLRGHNVKALKRKTSNTGFTQKIFEGYSSEGKQLFEKVEWVEGQTEDYISIRAALNGVSEVYHCAAIVSFGKRSFNQMLEVNVQGTANVVD